MAKAKTDIENFLYDIFRTQNFNCLSVGVVDFQNENYQDYTLFKDQNNHINPQEKIVFDLASLTKILTLSLSYFKGPKNFDSSLLLLLNHKGGLPAWARLSPKSWEEQILSYPIKESPTVYSDLGALRLMLELESRLKQPLEKICEEIFQFPIYFWKNLPENAFVAETGFRHGQTISGEVHDDNAYNLNQFCSHAGLFGTVEGLCEFLIYWNKNYQLLEIMEKEFSKKKKDDRFVLGWDTVENIQTTLAGNLASQYTIGHLGFTGTSVWVDLERKIGSVILTNATQNYFHEKKDINELRKSVSNFIWNASK